MSLLIITCDGDATAEFVVEHLERESIEFYQLHTDSMFSRGLSFSIGDTPHGLFRVDTEQGSLDLAKVKSVWLRRPLPPEPAPAITDHQYREGVIESGRLLLQNIYGRIPQAKWVNHPDKNRKGGRKFDQLVVAKELGLKVPKTLVTNSPTEAREFINRQKSGTVMKPLSIVFYDSGNPGEVYGSYTARVDEEVMASLDSLSLCPMIFQEEIEKQYEVRLTVIGDEIFAAKVDSSLFQGREVDWRIEAIAGAPWSICEVPENLKMVCREMLNRYGLLYGAFDFAFTPEGDYVFFELNPNGQWAWIEMETGMPMTKALISLLTNY